MAQFLPSNLSIDTIQFTFQFLQWNSSIQTYNLNLQ